MDKNSVAYFHKSEQTTLLDKFALEAMKLILAEHIKRNPDKIDPFTVGMLSYATALGMMAAREQPEASFQPKQPPKAEPPPATGLIIPPVS